MGVEIERKFLLRDASWRPGVERAQCIRQGYLVGARALRAGSARASVRVRVTADQAWITVKAAVPGIRRAEYEVPLCRRDAEELLDTLCDGLIEKTRHRIVVDGTLFEIDEFAGDNDGLIVAEVELRTEDQALPAPAWLGREVTALARYDNVNLVQHPFKHWTEEERQGC
jgi:adenylate cyclase